MTNLYLYQAMMRDALRPRQVVIWILVSLALFGMSIAYQRVTPGPPSEIYPTLAAMLVFRVLPLAAAIFSTSVVSAEVEQKTIVYLLTRPVARWRLLATRSLAAMTMVGLVGVFCAVLVSVATYGSSFLANPYLWRDLPSILVGSAAYCALFIFLSLLINRSMIVNLLFAFAWETSIQNMPGNMSLLSISTYLTAIAERPAIPGGSFVGFLSGSLAGNTMGAAQAWTTMSITVVVLSAASLWWFSHFEYTPREDAA